MAENCPTCGQPVPVVTTDDRILRALDFTSQGRWRPIPAQLYAAADKDDSRISDLSQWYITGPPTRAGWVRGPIGRDQVERLAQAGKIAPDLIGSDGKVACYALAKFARHRVLP